MVFPIAGCLYFHRPRDPPCGSRAPGNGDAAEDNASRAGISLYDSRSHLLTATEVDRCIALSEARCLLLCIGCLPIACH